MTNPRSTGANVRLLHQLMLPPVTFLATRRAALSANVSETLGPLGMDLGHRGPVRGPLLLRIGGTSSNTG